MWTKLGKKAYRVLTVLFKMLYTLFYRSDKIVEIEDLKVCMRFSEKKDRINCTNYKSRFRVKGWTAAKVTGGGDVGMASEFSGQLMAK